MSYLNDPNRVDAPLSRLEIMVLLGTLESVKDHLERIIGIIGERPRLCDAHDAIRDELFSLKGELDHAN